MEHQVGAVLTWGILSKLLCKPHTSDKTKQLSRCFVPKAISPELAAPSSLVQIGTYDQGQGIFKWSEVSSTDVLCQLYDLILSSAPKTFVTLSPPLWLWRRSLTPWICELMFKLMLFVAIVWWGCCDWHLPSKMMGNLPLCLLLLVWNYLCPSMYIVQGVFFNCFSQFSVPKRRKKLAQSTRSNLTSENSWKSFSFGYWKSGGAFKNRHCMTSALSSLSSTPTPPKKKRKKFVSWSKPPEVWSHLVYDQVGNLEWYWSVWTFENCGWCPWLQFDVNDDDDDDADDDGDNEDDS